MSSASDSVRFMVRCRCVGLSALLLGSLLLPIGATAASEREDLEALREEIRAERAAMAKEREALADQRRRLDDTLADLDQRESGVAGAPVESDAPKIRLDVYGFIHTDAIYDFNRVAPDWKSTLRPSKIPVNCPGDSGCGNDGETVLSVKQSRLGFRGYVPTPVGEIKTKFEFELFGVGDDAGETTFRLRHAWAELGQFGAGQTWSLFMDPDVFPNTIDYWGPVGMAFFRNAQIRWTPIDNEGIRFAVAVESAGIRARPGQGRYRRSQRLRRRLQRLEPVSGFHDARARRLRLGPRPAGRHRPRARLRDPLATTAKIRTARRSAPRAT